MIGKQIKYRFVDKKIILCGDFNTHLDGSYDNWPELRQISNLNLKDAYKTLNSNLGYTEDTNINKMRWNIKFQKKLFRYDAILLRNITPITCNIIGKIPFDLTVDETNKVIEFLKIQGLEEKLHNLVYKKDSNPKILDWWPSDHFGLVSELKLN
jgi:hypothetical protein